MGILDDKAILITGGTGTFGRGFVKEALMHHSPRKIVVYSRDEYKQFTMRQELAQYDAMMRYFLGDVRDRERLRRAFAGIDYVVHAAALKQVHSCEYNPFEAVKTNIIGAQNVVDAAIECGVQRVVALSTDKAVNPVNLYGATKLVSDKVFTAANAYTGNRGTCFSVVRYGNVAGSRGSIIPHFRALLQGGETKLPVTDMQMTRFWITSGETVQILLEALEWMQGGEIYVAKTPSFMICDLAKAINPGGTIWEIGIREGEKLHESMITALDAPHTYDYGDYYIIYPTPNFNWKNGEVRPGGKKVEEGFEYSSGTNSEWLTVEAIAVLLRDI